MVDFGELLKSLINAASIVAILVYLGKKAVELYLGKDIEKYKYGLNLQVEALKSKMNAEIEAYKNKLNILAKEQEIKFAKLHQERAELIKKIYLMIVSYEKKLGKYIEDMNGSEFIEHENIVRYKLIYEFNDVVDVYNSNRIYFSSETCKLLDSFVVKYEDVSCKLKLIGCQDAAKYHDIIKSVDCLIKDIIKPMESELAEEFRYLLGVKKML
jgi:hypothetical protein